MKRRLGNLERQLLAYAQLRKVGELRTGDLTRPLSINPKQERELRKLERALKRSTGFIPWIPTRPKRGMLERRWGIVWNDRG